MSEGLSRFDLVQFIGFLGEKGLMNPNSAAGRKAAVTKLLSILGDEEAADVTKLDLEDITRRFINLKGGEFKPDSLRVYKSRTEASIRDLVAYRKNPLGFKPISDQRAPRQADAKQRSGPEETSERLEPAKTAPAVSIGDNIIPIPLRADLVVRIAGIPPDMSQSEAKKLANVIMAYAAVE